MDVIKRIRSDESRHVWWIRRAGGNITFTVYRFTSHNQGNGIAARSVWEVHPYSYGVVFVDLKEVDHIVMVTF